MSVLAGQSQSGKGLGTPQWCSACLTHARTQVPFLGNKTVVTRSSKGENLMVSIRIWKVHMEAGMG
jgi:hypothetical protein